jgi:hypothetical protein
VTVLADSYGYLKKLSPVSLAKMGGASPLIG